MTILKELYIAYFNAIKHKKKKPYVKEFSKRLHHNLCELCEEITSHTYKARPSTCFIITDPKKREIFAADFRDRIVHHFFFNRTHKIFEKYFIHDSYSCIKGRGTHFGIKRLKHHILSESLNYTEPCYVLKLDIKGYFMHIDRNVLLKEILRLLNNEDEITKYLAKEIITLDPTIDCIVKGKKSDWYDLPDSKSLFKSKQGRGLPIGNLTSQLFSNVYMNIFDQWVKKFLKVKHYGRYVDDAFLVSTDKEWLKSLVPIINAFMQETLHIELQMGKRRIVNVYQGVEFLGAYILPYRTYISNQSLRRMRNKIYHENGSIEHKNNAMISRFGVLSHYKSYNIKKELFLNS